VRGLETGKGQTGKREHDDLEGDRREDGDIFRNDAGQAEHDRHAEDDAPTGEQGGMRVRVASVARCTSLAATPAAHERRRRDQQLGAVEHEENDEQRVDGAETIRLGRQTLLVHSPG
jgi:hypothetical protein